MKRQAPAWLRVLFGFGLVLFIAGAVLFFVRYRIFVVPSPSMVPTLQVGDRMIADTWDRTPQRGDIVVFDAKGWGVQTSAPSEVKRVVGVAGDVVGCCSVTGELSINGATVAEPYLNQLPGQQFSASATKFDVPVPAERVFLLGDNRIASVDSRSQLQNMSGTIAESAIQSTVVAIGFPLDRFSLIGGFGFANFFSIVLAVATAGLALTVLCGLVLLFIAAREFFRARVASRS